MYSKSIGAVAWQEEAASAGGHRRGPGWLERLRYRFDPRLKRQYRQLRQILAVCPLFDAAFYVHADPGLAASGVDPLWHYCTRGIGEGRNPSPYFFTSWYLAEYPEVAKRGLNPLLHYALHGVEEGTNPNPYFFTSWYLKRYPQVQQQGMHPLVHLAQPLLRSCLVFPHLSRISRDRAFGPFPCPRRGIWLPTQLLF